MTRSLATAARPHGIKCNLVAPAAFTRMAGAADADSPMATTMAPELVAPMVAFLAHEDCPVTGEIYSAGAGRFARIFIAQAEGYVDTTGAPTVEDVAAHWAEINDESAYTVPADLMDWSAPSWPTSPDHVLAPLVRHVTASDAETEGRLRGGRGARV